ncbi:MAG: type IX secretion system membrane protein PorP/SprF [Bacteroidia bacterium]
MNKKIITLIISLFSLGMFAQQDAAFSMYFFNPLYINPAYAGSREVFSGALVGRNQWAAMPGAPVSQALSIHSAIPNSRVGLGLQIYNDKAGPVKNTGITLTYAYHLPLNSKTKLSFGLSGMVNNVRIAYDQISIQDQNDHSFVGNPTSTWVPDANAGLYLYRSRFYCGLSVNHLIQSKFNITNGAANDAAKFYRQFYFTSGVVIPISKSVDLRPSVLLKYVQAAPLLGEVDATFIFFKRLYVGAGYRTDKRVNLNGMDNMVIGILQFEILNSLRIGYSYDYYINRTGSYNSGGTHEIMLGWDLSITKTKMSSPRFF